LSSAFDFFGEIIDDKAVVAVDVDVDVVVALVLVLVVSFAVGVAPGIDDNEVPGNSFAADEETGAQGDKGSSVSLGKLSVYNTLAELLFSTPFSFQQSCASISVPPNNMTSS
jgi:hypothetical protein